MKKINYALAILACALLALSAISCNDKDKEDEPEQNQYTFDGTAYPILSAGIQDQDEGDFGFIFSRIVVTDNFKDPPETYMHFIINEEDFGEATSVFRNLALVDYLPVIQCHKVKSGTVKLVKDGDNYTVDLDVALVDDDGTEHRMTGHYSGAPEVVLR